MANKGERVIRVRDPARVLELHVDKYRRTRTGSVVAVHHIGTGKWMSMRDYYLLQKAHEVLPILEKVVEGGYRVQAAILAFNPEFKFEAAGFGVTIPLPFGAALAGTALFDLAIGVESKNAFQTAKALFKLIGPFGLVLQAYESLLGAEGAAKAVADVVTKTVEKAKGVAIQVPSPIIPPIVPP